MLPVDQIFRISPQRSGIGPEIIVFCVPREVVTLMSTEQFSAQPPLSVQVDEAVDEAVDEVEEQVNEVEGEAVDEVELEEH